MPTPHRSANITLMDEGKARMIGGDCTKMKVHSVCLFECVFVVCTCVRLWKVERVNMSMPLCISAFVFVLYCGCARPSDCLKM